MRTRDDLTIQEAPPSEIVSTGWRGTAEDAPKAPPETLVVHKDAQGDIIISGITPSKTTVEIDAENNVIIRDRP